MTWTLAPSLKALFAELDKAWPGRDRTTDGSIGDPAHSARESQHNPNRDPGDTVPDGTVTAIDIDKDGISVLKVLDALIGDPRVWYVIHAGRIYSRTHGWKANPYTGENAHDGHIHVSLIQTGAACKDTSSWGIVAPARTKTPAELIAQLRRRVASQRRKIANLRRKASR